MAGEWRTATVQELVADAILERPIDGNHGEIHPKASDFVERGIPFIMASDLIDGRVDTTHCAFISEEQARSLRKGFARRGDVLISHKATMGRTAFIDQLDAPFLMLTPQVTYYRVKDQSRLSARYLKLYFDSPSFQRLFETWGHKGSTRSYLGITAQLDLPIVLPPPDEQRAIAHILGTLDDMIELNRRMNETLEAMARALFKSWFVDFDPVRAKAEGRDPGLPKPLADLFPARLVDSELGEIPEGWEVQRVGDIGTIVCGKTPPTQVFEYYGHDVPFITIPDMHGRIFATSVQKRLSRAGAQSQEKKMLPVGAICVSCIATAGLVLITSEPSQTNQQINSVVPNQKDASYFWYWTLRNLGDDIRAGGSGGSVLTNLSTGRFGELRLLASIARLRSCYHSIVAPAFGRILENEREASTLAALRDTLLPKLISGELRVKNAEAVVEAEI